MVLCSVMCLVLVTNRELLINWFLGILYCFFYVEFG